MIVGISGLMGSGKDTVADRLVDKHNFGKIGLADPLKRFCMEAYDFSFEQLWGPSEMRNKPDKRYPRKHTYNLESLEDGVCICCGWDSETVFGREIPQCYLTPRYALQMLGTEWGRGCYDKTWIEFGLRTAEKLMGGAYAYSAQRGVHIATPKCTGPGHSEDERCFFSLRGVVFSDFRFKNEIYPAQDREVRLWRTLRGDGKPKFDHPSETEQLEIPDSVFHNTINNRAPVVDPDTGECLEPGMTKAELYQIVDHLVDGLPW